MPNASDSPDSTSDHLVRKRRRWIWIIAVAVVLIIGAALPGFRRYRRPDTQER